MTQGQAALLVDDIIVSQGAVNDYGYVWSTKPDEDTPDESATPVPLLTDGWEARAQLRKTPGGTPWLVLTTTFDADGSGITLADDGSIVVHIAPATTEDAAWNSKSRATGVWDLELFKPADAQAAFRFVMGAVTVSPDVTREVT